MLNQQNSSSSSQTTNSTPVLPAGSSIPNISLNGSSTSSGPLQPIQVNNNKMNPTNQYQPRAQYFRPPPQNNQRPPFGMPPVFNPHEQQGDMSHQSNL